MLNTDIRTINSNRNQTRPKTSTKKESHLCRKKQNIVENPRQFFSISAWTEHWRTPANNNGGRGRNIVNKYTHLKYVKKSSDDSFACQAFYKDL